MGDVGNKPLPNIYYDVNKFQFTPAYHDFLSYVIDNPQFLKFDYDFPVVIPK